MERDSAFDGNVVDLNAHAIKVLTCFLNYLSGQLVIAGGAALPPQPLLTPTGVDHPESCAGTTEPTVPKPVADVAVGAGVLYAAGWIAGVAEDSVGVGTPVVGIDVVLLAAPFSFSCVRPYADTPSTAPMATWNKPPPCSVIGTH